MVLKYSLLAFICYLPFYLLLLFYLKTKIKGYNINTHVVSLLATSSKPWRQIFNLSTILYGLLSFVLPVSLLVLLGTTVLNLVGALFLITTGLTTALVGIFPMNGIAKIHDWVSGIVFSSVAITGIVFAIIFQQNEVFSIAMAMYTYLIIISAILLGLSVLFRKRTSSLFEWATLVGTIIWNFTFSVSLFKLW